MAYDKIQVNTGKTIAVLAHDTAPIPSPEFTAITGTTTSLVADKLVDSGGDFINKGVTVGSIVYNDTGTAVATVTAVDSATTLSLSANIFTTPPNNYTVYISNTAHPHSSDGCLLYVGSNIATMTVDDSFVDVKVKTVAGDTITFWRFPVGNYLPVQVVQLFKTGTDAAAQNNCIAIW